MPDPLVQLHDLRRAPRPYPLRGVLLLTYRDDTDLPHLLKTLSASGTRVDTLLHDSQHVASDGPSEHADRVGVDTVDISDDPNTDVGGFAEMSSIPAAGAPQVHTPTEDEVKNALKIQRAYRDMILRRNRTTPTRRDQARQRFFEQCLSCAQNLGWKRSAASPCTVPPSTSPSFRSAPKQHHAMRYNPIAGRDQGLEHFRRDAISHVIEINLPFRCD